MDKSTTRQQLRQLRRSLPISQRQAEDTANAGALTRYLSELATYEIAAYWPYGSEANTQPWFDTLWQQGMAVFLPRCLANYQLSWHPVRNPSQLVAGSYDILEPDPQQVPAAELPANTVVIVPGLGFTATGQRLGQGAGYYDRALARRLPNQIWIGFGYSCQLCQQLPTEDHDQELQGVLLGGEWVKPPSAEI